MIGRSNNNHNLECFERLGDWDDKSISIIKDELLQIGMGEYLQAVNNKVARSVKVVSSTGTKVYAPKSLDISQVAINYKTN